MTVELDNVMADTVANKTGSLTGEDMTLRSTGVQVMMKSFTPSVSSAVVSSSITNQTVKFSVPVTVTAFDETVYLNKSAIQNVAATYVAHSSAEGFAFSLIKNNAIVATTATVDVSSADAPTNSAGTIFRVDSGVTRNFIVDISLTGQAAAATTSNFKIEMEGVRVYTDSAATVSGTTQELTPDNSFRSSTGTVNF